jgi:hypothetical protein
MLLRAMAAAGAHVLRSWAWYAVRLEGVFEHSFVVDHLCCNAVDGAVKLNGHEVRPVLAAERHRAFLGGGSIWGMSALAKLIISYGGCPQTFRGNSHRLCR